MESVNTKSIRAALIFSGGAGTLPQTYICIPCAIGSFVCTRACFCLSIRLMTTSKCVQFYLWCARLASFSAARLSPNAHFPHATLNSCGKSEAENCLSERAASNFTLMFVTQMWAWLDQYFQFWHFPVLFFSFLSLEPFPFKSFPKFASMPADNAPITSSPNTIFYSLWSAENATEASLSLSSHKPGWLDW